MKMSKNLKIILYIASVLIVVCLVLLLESPTDSSKRCYSDDVLASYVFGLYDAIGPLKINLSKEREKYVWDYCKIIYSACTSLVIDLYNWSLASNSWFFD